MRLPSIFFILLLISALQANAELERGVKAVGLEEIILVGSDDWQSTIASTPLTVDDRGNVVKPQLILPKKVNAGDRISWIEYRDLQRYGVIPVLNTLQTANVSAVILHGDGDLGESFVKTAHKEGILAYVTVTLEPPESLDSELIKIEDLATDKSISSKAIAMLLDEIELEKSEIYKPNSSKTVLSSDTSETKLSVSSDDVRGYYFCPVDPEARNDLYNQVEHLIEDYEVDGVILFNFGFQNENYCFCEDCKEQFYKDTGVDLTRIYSSSYNLQLWRDWREEKTLDIVKEVRNMTGELPSVRLGVALQDPFERSQGYDYTKISQIADLMIISPLPVGRAELAANITGTPVYVRLSNDYVEYTISTQNVEGTVDYIEDLVDSGVAGLAFEYDVVYTPLYAELEPPSNSARWLLEKLGGKTLGVGDVLWDCDSRIMANNSFEMAEMIAGRWESSPGAVIVGDNYSSGLTAATIAAYLNWPILFTGEELPDETESALKELGAEEVIVVGTIPGKANNRLEDLNLTVIEGNRELLLQEMRERGENVSAIVLTNSCDLSLLKPAAKSDKMRGYIDDIYITVDVCPTEIPAESYGEIIRLNITLVNEDDYDVEELVLTDLFKPGTFVRWSKPNMGTVELTDPIYGGVTDLETSFIDGSILTWRIDKLGSGESATLALEVEILYAMDAGWVKPIDCGISLTHLDLEDNMTTECEEDWPITDISYPTAMPVGIAEISWKVAETPFYTAINYFNPEGEDYWYTIWDCEPDKLYTANITLNEPGTWIFNIEASNDYWHITDNYTIDVSPALLSTNLTAFAHTKIPRLSLTSPQIAAARKAIIVDVAEDPQNIDPLVVEEDLQELVEDMSIAPKYLIVVGGPGALPFITTGTNQQDYDLLYENYREYQIQLDLDDYQEVASGRIIGPSVYDASQLVARTLAYDKIGGEWRNKSLMVSSPSDYPATWPMSPVPARIGEYLSAAGMDAENLRWEDATFQRVTSRMNNGENIAHFCYHGVAWAWELSIWSLLDISLDETQVKLMTLAPQTTTTSSCLTSRLKGLTINIEGTDMYMPMRLDDSIALAFLKAGSVNYIGSTTLSMIFLSDDHSNKFYQALVFENATVGEALMEANNLYIMKMKSAEGIKFEDMDESFVADWDLPLEEIFNQTSSEFMLFGDPAFRPYIPRVERLPYETNISKVADEGELAVSITPTREMATDWIYWIKVDTVDGELRLNAPPALIGELMLPEDAEDVVVKENGRVVWHEEDTIGSVKKVSWPVVSPALNESRNYTVEYRLVPGLVQVINITSGWNSFSIYLEPKEPSVTSILKRLPYRSIFTVKEKQWNYTFEDSGEGNVTVLEPGVGYIIDSSDNFTLEIPGKPVELPFKIKLNIGWNLIGIPVNETVPVSNITVSAMHKRYTYSEAVEEGIISAFLWSYKDDRWDYMGLDGYMVPGEAYMVEAMNDCRLEF